MSKVRVIRVVSKKGVKLAPKTSYSLSTLMGIQGLTPKQDGKTLSWGTRYSATYDKYAIESSFAPVTVDLALGTLKLDSFMDRNLDGVRNPSETDSGPEMDYEVLDDNGQRVSSGKVATKGPTEITGLISGKTYKVRVTNPDVSKYLFTTGQIEKD